MSACITVDGAFNHENGDVGFDELRHDTTSRFQTPKREEDVQEQRPAPVRTLRQQGDHHEELRHVQAIAGTVEAPVELHQTLRVARQSSTPRPISGVPGEKAQDLHQNRWKRPRPQAPPKDPRKCAHTQDETRSQRRHAGRKHAGHGRESIKYLSTWSAWLPCADVGDACREHAD